MANKSNLLDLSETTTNALRKPQFVEKIMNLKNKVVFGDKVKSLCTHVKELTKIVSQLLVKMID